VENNAEILIDFLDEKRRKISVVITTRPQARLRSETRHHFSNLLYKKLKKREKFWIKFFIVVQVVAPTIVLLESGLDIFVGTTGIVN
jgi:hypothetical protein